MCSRKQQLHKHRSNTKYKTIFQLCAKNLLFKTILLTKTTTTQNEDALNYYRVRGLYFLAVIFVRSIGLANNISQFKSLNEKQRLHKNTLYYNNTQL